MPRGCKWHFVGDYSSEGGPASAQAWSMYVSKDAAGEFHVQAVGDEIGYACCETPELLVGFFADYGDDYLSDLRDTAARLKGYADVIRMIDFRLRDKSQIRSHQ